MLTLIQKTLSSISTTSAFLIFITVSVNTLASGYEGQKLSFDSSRSG